MASKARGNKAWEEAMVRSGHHQADPDKRRRLAYMRARYKPAQKCSKCNKVAFWSWTRYMSGKRRFYCDDHLPERARAAIQRAHVRMFEVAPFFDTEPEGEEDTEWTL